MGNKEYITYPFYADDVPVDISYIFKEEKPAGKHGFLKVQGDAFCFEDGTAARFWGTNFNGGANFPSHSYSETVAKRLAKTGINLVRFHQLDAEWNTPNIFRFTKGPLFENTLEPDPESMERLDYLIYCLKKEGIYCYMDTFTYRRFKEGDGVENAVLLPDAAKPYGAFDRRMIELQKKLAADIWNHENPYTGLCYKDDPVFVLAEVVNESDLFSKPITVEPYVSEFKVLFSAWIKKEGIAYDVENCDINAPDDDVLLQFKIHTEESYYREMTAFLREIGVKIPLTGTNWTQVPALTKAQHEMDFIDTHTYLYDWNWGETEKNCTQRAITHSEDNGLETCVRMRMEGKPFYVSEWDMPWPNAYRAESPILYAAIGALQGWSGLAIHTYSYGTRLSDMKMLGKEVSSDKIGDIPYREGIFTTWNDPAKFGLFYHAALITRRGDVKACKTERVIRQADMKTWNPEIRTSLLEKEKCSIRFRGADVPPKEEAAAVEVKSADGQMYRNWEKNFGYIDTARTKCVYGFLGKNTPVEISGLSVECENDFAVIAISALSYADMENAENMLLTTVGRAENSGAGFEGEKMTAYGTAPVLLEKIKGRITLRTNIPNLKVWAVNAEGFYTGTVPSEYKEGQLSFRIGDTSPSLYYLLQKE